MKSYDLLPIALLSIASSLIAEVHVSELFSDHMILQQEASNAIWGTAEPNEKITISASWGAQAETSANNAGKWKAFLSTPAYGTDHSLKIQGDNIIDINNVAIGEVWLCAGQSNMGWSMGNSFEAEQEANVILPNFRIFKSAREHWHEPLDEKRDRLDRWKTCNPESAAETSAVSYYFGKKLHLKLDVPVGIIVQAFAGTPIEGWMPWDVQKNNARSQLHKADLDATAQRQTEQMGMSAEQAIAAYNQELVRYNAQIDAGETMKNKVKSLAPPIITKPANLGHQYPAHQFNAMIHPIRPYGIRGAIWYQGERNSKNVPQTLAYREQLALLINYYRVSWNELSDGNVAADFPFQFTQLPSWNPAQIEPVEGPEAVWSVNREMMRLTSLEVPHTAMAVSIDTGDAVALHPKNKKPIGLRHAYLALKNTYNKDIIGSGPRYQSQTSKDDTLTLHFDSCGSGLVAAKDEPLNSFAIAGKNETWHWATATIKGDTIELSSPNVPAPLAARYAWAMNPSQRNLLYNREGIPASPFRTDNWPLFDPTAEIITVLKPSKDRSYQSKDWQRPAMTQ